MDLDFFVILGLGLEVDDFVFASLTHRDFIVFEIHDTVGVADDGGGVGGNVGGVACYPQQEWGCRGGRRARDKLQSLGRAR